MFHVLSEFFSAPQTAYRVRLSCFRPCQWYHDLSFPAGRPAAMLFG